MPAIQNIGQIAMNVHDLDRAVGFYRDTLGLKHLFSAPNLAFFDCGGVRLMLGMAEKTEFDHPGSILYYRVDDLMATHKELVNRGVSFEREPHMIATMPDHELWMAFARDTEGNMFGLMHEKR
jgi:methylmalonyl-CoA/ethylmalonyl-CoA epimerase